MSERKEFVEAIGEDLVDLVDEVLDKRIELEEQGIDPHTFDWSTYKERFKALNEDADARIIGILSFKPRLQQRTIQQTTLI